MDILKSAQLFLWGLLRRFYFWLPAIFLDPFDLYEKFKPGLPEALRVNITFPSGWGLMALVLLLAWAAIMTFHEIRKDRDDLSATRSPQPDVPILNVVHRVLGTEDIWADGMPSKVGEVLKAIRQHGCLGALTIWGRRDCREGNEAAYPLSTIPAEYWDYFGINYLEFLKNKKGTTEPWRLGATGDVFHDLFLNSAQMSLVWPSQPRRRLSFGIRLPW